MNREKISKALDEISDRHISEAAAPRRKAAGWYLAPIAAALAIVILALALTQSGAVQAKAVSIAKYPGQSANYPEKPSEFLSDRERDALADFFAKSMQAVLSEDAGQNRTFSPANLYMALAELSQLTQGQAQQEILNLLTADSQSALAAQANRVWNACYYTDKHTKATMASSIWLGNALEYDQDVMDALAGNFYTSVYQTDFASARAARDIAAWLNQQTGNFLKDMARPEITEETVFSLYSTVYFRSKWAQYYEFSAKNNTTGPFHAPGGDVSCTYMQKTYERNYYWGTDFGAMSIPLREGYAMWFILPDADKTPEDVLSSMEYIQLFSGKWENSKYVKINLSVPKFDISQKSHLSDALRSLGVSAVFEREAAPFSGAVTGEAWLSNINQATRVAIDEEGVTAASYIDMPATGAAAPPEEIIDFILDRPFLFAITSGVGIPLFAGVVAQP